ncbi:1,4-alpha-glucan branching protein GlgB [Heyndrickxia acidiproducens]|uniref:1,4-alpha-glucan branching protein GlgB n=1 Tax=Heyndrickxia acidiproducens TaxID=1121084 RepID=UPI00047690FA|nr:1,4-alpha-glucan branching protein GlgB [Heyndrickxia acidiproducens]
MEKTVQNHQQISPTEFDTYLFHEGTLYESYKTLGAHAVEIDGQKGVKFAVWAPHAKSVSVVGSFNDWEGSSHPMLQTADSGIWVLFVPGLKSGELYKYEIETPDGQKVLKADPYAFYSELRPKTASIVYELDNYTWHDHRWMKHKPKYDPYHKPMLIYEMHFGSWKKKPNGDFFTYREMADECISYLTEHGYTHIELMPMMEHPFDRSWGYQITGFYSITSRYGKPEDFMYFVDQCHQNGIGIILDWVPVHFCKDAHGLGRFDGTPLYEPVDPDQAERPIWGTYNFDFKKPEIFSFLISNAIFWMDVYHIDGFRVDAVSSLIYLNHDRGDGKKITNQYGGDENPEAVDFIKKLNEAVFRKFPNALMIAEEATAWPLVTAPTYDRGLGFNFKWNMGWVHDVLRYMQTDEDKRPEVHNLLTFSFHYAFSENYVLPFSHDEVVYGKRSLLNKMPGDFPQKFANLRLLYAYFITHPGKKLIFMGSEFGQFDEWKDLTELDWNLFEFDTHRKFFQYTKALNAFYNETRSLWRLDHEQEGFEWIDANNRRQSIIIFIRKGKRRGDYCIVLCNFSKKKYENFRIGVPSFGKYIEIFNSDDEKFGGSGQLNKNAIQVDKEPFHNQPYSMAINIPPLSALIFEKQTTKRRRGGRK